MLKKGKNTRMNEKREHYPDPEWQKKNKHPKQLQIDITFTFDGEDSNCTSKLRYLSYAWKRLAISWRTERMSRKS